MTNDELPEKLKFTNDTISGGKILRRITGYEIDSVDARETAIAEELTTIHGILIEFIVTKEKNNLELAIKKVRELKQKLTGEK